MIYLIVITVFLIAMVGIVIQSRIDGEKAINDFEKETFICSDPGDEIEHIYNK